MTNIDLNKFKYTHTDFQAWEDIKPRDKPDNTHQFSYQSFYHNENFSRYKEITNYVLAFACDQLCILTTDSWQLRATHYNEHDLDFGIISYKKNVTKEIGYLYEDFDKYSKDKRLAEIYDHTRIRVVYDSPEMSIEINIPFHEGNFHGSYVFTKEDILLTTTWYISHPYTNVKRFMKKEEIN